MSETPENPSTTKEERNSTRTEITPISDLIFTIGLNIHVKADPELVTALQKIASCLERISPLRYPSENTEPPVFIEPIMDQGVAEKPYGRVVFRGDEPDEEWIKVAQNKRLNWKQERKILFVRYYTGVVQTTWEDMVRISKIKSPAEKTAAIKLLLGKSFSANNRTGISLFTKFLQEGTIKRPSDPDEELETDFSKFSEEEDLDAAFRPFVTPYHSSKPDENCGKVEGVGV